MVDGYITPEFYELLKDLKAKNETLLKTTTLPKSIDIEKYNEFVLKMYREANLWKSQNM